MKNLGFTLLTLLIATIAVESNAATLELTNKTGYDMRITMLHNRCDVFSIDDPVKLPPNKTFKVLNISPVVQSIEVCGVGICVMSAIGMKENIIYKVDIVLDQGFIDYKATPDHWIGTNTECPK